MIYTCTLNPSIDYIVEVEDVKLGSLNRATKTAYYPGGKGINVSRVLSRLGSSSTALGYIGGFTGAFIRDVLAKSGIANDFIEVNEPTRINIKLKTGKETEINGLGASITKEEESKLFEKISALSTEDFLVLAGSLPPNVSADFYSLIAKLCFEKNIPFIVDTSGVALEGILHYEPFLVKPNEHELGELFGVAITSLEEAVNYGKKLHEKGPKNVIVSLGSKGAVLINDRVIAHANVPKGELKNSVGAGDSLVAGFVLASVSKKNDLEALKYGIACGSATAFSLDLCEKLDVEKLLPEIKINILS
ncbi:1-phosphofructokinase [Anaerobacillus alkaliphilus]|uniref:Tagatose-6-phosphate kinase n=1 Tax=Anaerobacillus alkaliphilus TaxID=1548597 RepID=A0A4Q0VSP1_9BACI|nr:1-phosphofructokinase [Anaerobacillus alkaliphilus]RXI99822.1 1-phosphofructokinase [Anaerobacillus alkaliphilus]